METGEAENLYRKHFSAIYSVCFLYMKNEADACDMVQETFLKLLQGNFVYKDDEKTYHSTEIAKMQTEERRGKSSRRYARKLAGDKDVVGWGLRIFGYLL